MRQSSSRDNLIDSTFLAIAISFVSLLGCEQREKVVDVETPIGNVEVTESHDGESVQVEVDSNKPGE